MRFLLLLSKDGQGNCCEVILPLDDLYDECAEIFANSIFYALSNNMSIGRGLLIEGTDSIIDGFSDKKREQNDSDYKYIFAKKDPTNTDS